MFHNSAVPVRLPGIEVEDAAQPGAAPHATRQVDHSL